ncbi:replication protein A 32 kDa subunit-like isoform X2 [Lycorma delicatula]|uniref:replication protein A 32 kDa subunit-like isoform X2 n=1 Tax=Lycorma delicatula TaxID=130591 RepID=UPI003F51379E
MEKYEYSLYSKRGVDTIAHVTIKQIMDCQDDSLKIGNTEIGCVCIVGIVRSIEASSMKIVYSVEDNTGVITVMHWLNEDRGTDAGVPVVENTYCQVYGKMRMQNDKKFIIAFSIKPVIDLSLITVHRLQVIYTVFKLEQLQQQETEQYSMKQESSSTGMTLGADRMQLGNMGDTSYGLNPQQLRVYRAIQQCKREGGASREEISGALTLKMPGVELEKVLDFLVSEGHIYTTTDENHFMATDFA